MEQRNVVWKVSTILKCFRDKYMEKTAKGLEVIKEAIGQPNQDDVLNEVFPQLESLSVDYGIMEKAENIYTIPGNFGWDDVGSWLAVGRIKENDKDGNVVNGNVVAIDTKNCVIEGQEKLIAAVGLTDIVIVDIKDATLVAAKESAGQIKQILAKLREDGRNEYL